MDTGHGELASCLLSKTASAAVQQSMQDTNNWHPSDGKFPKSISDEGDRAKSHVSNSQDGSNVASFGGTSASFGSTSVPHSYHAYAQASDPYGYGYTGYQGYYSSYQQQPSHHYSQPLGTYQTAGALHQPLSSFQNPSASIGHANYSSTHYSPGDYQNSNTHQVGGYPGLKTLSSGQCGSYDQYSSKVGDTNSYTSNVADAASMQYQQHYKQWADYYNQTEVMCAPGTENLSVPSTSNLVSAPPGVSSSYSTYNNLPQQTFGLSWKPEIISSQFPELQVQQPTSSPKGHSVSNPVGNQLPPDQQLHPHFSAINRSNADHLGNMQLSHGYHFQLQNISAGRVSKVQIPTNTKIAPSLVLSVPKTDVSLSISSTLKPAYVKVAPKLNEREVSNGTSISMFQHSMFPASLRGYVERALARCKDETQMAACRSIMKEIITKATADGNLHSRDWDTEPLFPLPCLDRGTGLKGSVTKKRSPNRPWKSRWEPVAKEVSTHTTNGSINFTSLVMPNKNSLKDDGLKSTISVKNLLPRPVKRPHVDSIADGSGDGNASSGSDKEQSLIAYYSGAITLSNSPEEKVRRENRSKRFEKSHGHQTEKNRVEQKTNGAGNLYARRANAFVLSKSFDVSNGKAVEDIDWDALTVRGTCQEIEKRYLRLTSAPDPSAVRPEEVLEKALYMVQNSLRNYLFKCDQLKSIRQDLTVQRIHNELTVKVYETHARLALENGDLPEYNQCQSQLKSLYAEGVNGCHMEFAAYNLLCVILHSNNNRDLLSAIYRLSHEAKKHEAVKHALAVRAAVTSGNYIMFFRLYKEAPNLNSCLMDLYVEKMRYSAVRCMARSYRPTVPVSYISHVLGFIDISSAVESSGMESCTEWLRTHGACLIGHSLEEMQLDAKASSGSLYMPEPEDAVAHGDTGLAVNDFLTRSIA